LNWKTTEFPGGCCGICIKYSINVKCIDGRVCVSSHGEEECAENLVECKEILAEIQALGDE